MRPFGHTEAKTEREACIVPVDTRLQEASRKYFSSIERYNPYDDNLEQYRFARRLLRPLQLSVSDLHHFVLTHFTSLDDLSAKYDYDIYGSDLGIFMSAGYQLLPQKRIVYDLHLPHIDCLGAFLREKELRITGHAGNGVGQRMIGKLTNDGRVGDNAGYRMIGRFDNRGTHGENIGIGMIGQFISASDDDVAGEFTGKWNDNWRLSAWMRMQRKEFLRESKNPKGRSYEECYDRLKRRYA
jgi:hypothetical protein